MGMKTSLGGDFVAVPCLTCAANHYCPEHNPEPGRYGDNAGRYGDTDSLKLPDLPAGKLVDQDAARWRWMSDFVVRWGEWPSSLDRMREDANLTREAWDAAADAGKDNRE